MNIELAFKNHQKELINFSERIVYCREIAEDICQESYIVLVCEAQKQQIDNPRSYLFRVARNFAYDYLKHKRVTDNYSQSLDPTIIPPMESLSVEELASNDQIWEIAQQVIDELPPRRRKVFILHKIYGLSYLEIAQTMEISESGVEKHMIKALSHCRKQLTGLLPALH
ncbi:MAG: RNA polymerase sigma factor [Methyloglobulus sp.]|jgi:RNA polymerase sigma factor (sigma-70 family)|nr:RNA polymerase sigma factor [Methyloglobulus sp.]